MTNPSQTFLNGKTKWTFSNEFDLTVGIFSEVIEGNHKEVLENTIEKEALKAVEAVEIRHYQV